MSLLQMSFSAAIMILAIIIVRALTMNKLPKKMFVLLWEVVLLRLLIPVSIPSIFSIYSLLKKAEPVRNVLTKIPEDTIIYKIVEEPLNLGTVPVEIVQQPERSISIWIVIWIVGMMLCILFFVITYLRGLFEFRISIPLHNEITDKWLEEHQLKRHIHLKQSDRITAPLTYGIVKPVILMPKKTDWDNEQQLRYILCHEYIHICRLDIVVKLIVIVALCIHWFNPWVWVMYILFNRDIELSCDESVVRRFGESSRADYAKTLITMEEKKSGLTPLYNSFSRNAIEERIVAIMKTKKATVGVIVASILIIAAVVVLFVTSAEESEGNARGDNAGTAQELEETQSVEWIGVYKDPFTTKDEEGSNYDSSVSHITEPPVKSEETAEIEVIVSDFAQAYFMGDTDILAQYWTSTAYEGTPEVYLGKAEDVQIVAIKGVPASVAAQGMISVSVEFKETKDADSYTYLTVELVEVNDEWKVQGCGLEK